MTTHIDYLVSEVIPQPEPGTATKPIPGSPSSVSTRSAGQLLVDAQRRRWLSKRLCAEGFDD